MQRDSDYLLWLNDDTELLPDALTRLLEAEQRIAAGGSRPGIIVGSTADPTTGRLTYGGHVATRPLRPFSYERVWSETEPVECDAMNGNSVLIPIQVALAIGNLDPNFEHAMGDYDYALRAKAAGIGLFVAPGFIGYCKQRGRENTYMDTELPLNLRWKRMMAKTGLPPRSWMRFTRLHGGPAWPVYFLWPYVKLIFSCAIRRKIR